MLLNIRFLLTIRLLIGIANHTVVFSSIWWFAENLDSILSAGIIYLIYRGFEIYLMPFTSSIADTIDRRWLMFITAGSSVFVMLIYSFTFITYNFLPIWLSIPGMVVFGVIASLNTGLLTAFLHDTYKSRVKVVLRLNGIIGSVSTILTPIISVAYTISFGSEAAIYLSTIISILGLYFQYRILGLGAVIFMNKKKSVANGNLINKTISIMRGALSIPIERRMSLMLFTLNMLMTPIFMVVLPYLASNNHYSFPQAVAIFDIAFGIGFIISSKYIFKWIKNIFTTYIQVLIGMILLYFMINTILISDNYLIVSTLYFIGGLGLPLIVMNISSFRINACPHEIKSQCYSTLVFFSLLGNPFSIGFVTYLCNTYPYEFVGFYNFILSSISLAVCVFSYKTLKGLNSFSEAKSVYIKALGSKSLAEAQKIKDTSYK